MRHLAACICASLVAALASAPAASAQSVTCLDSLSSAAFTRAPVYLVSRLADSSAAPAWLRSSVALVAQSTAIAIRAAFRQGANVLPNGEPDVTWRSLGGHVDVVVRSDGSYRGHLVGDSSDAVDSASSAATRILRALDSLSADGDRMPWEGGLPGDSAAFVLDVMRSRVTRDSGVLAPTMTLGFPIVSLAQPWRTEVAVERVRVAYPAPNRASGYVGNITMRFVVRADGRADPASIADVWPSNRPRLPGRDGHAYDEFRRTVARAIEEGRYRPATVGGCAVAQIVMQPFTFELRR